MSKLGHVWFKEQMNNCPSCGYKPTLGTNALSGKYMVACMNCCCSNMTAFYNDYWGRAIINWNKYTRGVKK